MTEPLVAVRGLRKHYPGAGIGAATVAVDGVDLEVHPGEIVGLIGESGCGKTSLVRTALGLLRRDGGEARLLGEDPERARGAARTRLRTKCQLLLQDAGASLNPGLTVRETLRESARVHRPGVPGAVDDALSQVDLTHRADARPHALSGGERRRATLAMLWLADPLLTVADEPTAGLDAPRKAELLDLLLSRRTPESGFLLISHDLPLILYACTRVVVMSEGRLVDGFVPGDIQRDSPRDSHPGRHATTRRLLWASGMLGSPL